ncbi:MAG: hypothetical protein HKN74_12195 [Acidimicrobiia bacterium]|nr:hypothetical protein [Acidimicrobiia bacterium]MBT8217325.1 hypothetical protein [Acidimicrobiia bacterium]NNF11036.1 hypothetical protein [Acidimicrobiia bacterium]NNL71172.1 hypothetical protein [Acidimicrobiia bacterium]
MKRIIRLLTLAGAVVGAVWYAKQHTAPDPTPADGSWEPRPQLRAVPDPAPPAATADDLTAIKGIGPVYAEQLSELGIRSFSDLATADAEALAGSFDGRAAVSDWIEEARSRTGA